MKRLIIIRVGYTCHDNMFFLLSFYCFKCKYFFVFRSGNRALLGINNVQPITRKYYCYYNSCKSCKNLVTFVTFVTLVKLRMVAAGKDTASYIEKVRKDLGRSRTKEFSAHNSKAHCVAWNCTGKYIASGKLHFI